jgi:glycosyl transferase family 87
VLIALLLSSLGAAYYGARISRMFSDFYGNVWWPGHRILDLGGDVPVTQTGWPATATAAVAPFALLPAWLAIALWTILSVAALVGGLWLVGCRDPRALAVAALSPPVLSCVVLGNMTLFLVAGVAVVWACRDRPALSGSAAGLLIVAKLWLWPLAVFLLVTRRWLSSLTAASWCAGAALLWWLVSPATFERFDERSDDVLARFAQWGMGVTSLLVNSGTSLDLAKLVALGLGLAILVAAWRTSSELGVFTLCLAAALLASPLVWAHYYAVLFVPIAIVAPRLGLLWFAPFLCGAAFLWPDEDHEFAVAAALSLCGLGLVTLGVLTARSRDTSVHAEAGA